MPKPTFKIQSFLKLLVIATIFTIGSATKPNPKFTLTKDRLIGEVPSVSIEFPDGSKDTLILRKFYSNNQDRFEGTNRCNFIGHLAVVSIKQYYFAQLIISWGWRLSNYKTLCVILKVLWFWQFWKKKLITSFKKLSQFPIAASKHIDLIYKVIRPVF